MKENAEPEHYGYHLGNAFENKDEAEMKYIIIKAMNVFLKNPTDYDEDWLEALAETYFINFSEDSKECYVPYEFKDRKLAYVFQELSHITEFPTKRAIENVKRFIKFLNDEEYEKIDHDDE